MCIKYILHNRDLKFVLCSICNIFYTSLQTSIKLSAASTFRDTIFYRKYESCIWTHKAYQVIEVDLVGSFLLALETFETNFFTKLCLLSL
jgi:hypothetical protein